MPGGQKKQRGDTIVEVMVVLAVLGLALGICYATANRSLLNTRQAQENSTASQLVQSQVEALRNLTGNTSGSDDIFTQNGPFCVNTSGDSAHVVPIANSGSYPYSGACNQDSLYNLSIVYPASSQDSNAFKVTASWDDVLGQGTDTVTSYYRLYGPPSAGPASGTVCGTQAATKPVGLNYPSYSYQNGPVYSSDPGGAQTGGQNEVNGAEVWFDTTSGTSSSYPFYTATDQKLASGWHGGVVHRAYSDGGTLIFSLPAIICEDQNTIAKDFANVNEGNSPSTPTYYGGPYLCYIDAVAYPDNNGVPDYQHPYPLKQYGASQTELDIVGGGLQSDGGCYRTAADSGVAPAIVAFTPTFSPGQTWFTLSTCLGPPYYTCSTAKTWDVMIWGDIDGCFYGLPIVPPGQSAGECGGARGGTTTDLFKDYPGYYQNWVQFDTSNPIIYNGGGG